MTIHQYRNPPILEAVCEVEFAPASEWNISYPWLFYDKVKSVYTGAPREQKLVRLDPPPAVAPQNGAPPFTVNEQTKIQFPLADDTGLVAVGTNVLSAHINKPYLGWEVFRARIADALNGYISITKPNGIRKIGLRYINQITIPEPQPNLSNYFATPPANVMPDQLFTDNFFSRNEYVYRDEPIRVALTFARAEAAPAISAFLVDIDLVWQWPAEPLNLESALNKIDELRRRERVIFENLITAQSRELFDAT